MLKDATAFEGVEDNGAGFWGEVTRSSGCFLLILLRCSWGM